VFRPDAIVIHYTDSVDVPASMVDQWHMRRGFTPRGSNSLKYIGYHALVRQDGTIEAGRSLDVQGTHCLHHNSHTIAICMCGSDLMPWYPTEAQYRSVAAWCKARMNEYNIPASRIYFHRDLNSTSCPGKADKNKILSLIDSASGGGEEEEEMYAPLQLLYEGGGVYVYAANPVFRDTSFAFYADVPDDYSVDIYIHPVAGQPTKKKEGYGCGGYGNPDVKGAMNVVGTIYPDLNGVASMVIHSPHKLVGGAW